jgi:hypothetical protein
MDSGQLTAVMIVAIIMLASIIRSVVRGPRHPLAMPDRQGEMENRRLRDEVSQLKDRIKVLERIAVEKENSLANEIESLRNR